MQRNLTSCPHRSGMMSWRRPLLGPHSLSVNPCETRATAGGLKNHRRSPPSAATIGAAARRLGKVWQLKSIQGSVKHQPCRSPPPRLTHTQRGGGDRNGREREKNMFGLQISQNIGSDPGWGVRKWRENFLHRWWCWRYPKVFTTRTTFCAKWRFWGRKLCCAFKHQNSDKLDKNSLCKNWCPLLIWQQNKR